MIGNTLEDGCGAGQIARRRNRRVTAGVIAAVTAVWLLSGCGGTPKPAVTPATEAPYGALPSFLPTAAARADTALTGTVQHPALTVQGDAVNVVVPAGAVTVTVAGPQVPGQGLPDQTPTATCTWTVTMAGASAPVPVDVGDFTTLDHLGGTYRPALVPGQPVPPPTIGPGQTVTFELRAVMTVGEGLIRWAPGHNLVASWDFEVEND